METIVRRRVDSWGVRWGTLTKTYLFKVEKWNKGPEEGLFRNLRQFCYPIRHSKKKAHLTVYCAAAFCLLFFAETKRAKWIQKVTLLVSLIKPTMTLTGENLSCEI